MLRYVQVHTLDDPLSEAFRASRDALEPFDGIAELWWKDRQELDKAFAMAEAQRAWEEILEDERRFIDFSRSSLWLAKEHLIFDELRLCGKPCHIAELLATSLTKAMRSYVGRLRQWDIPALEIEAISKSKAQHQNRYPHRQSY